MSLRGEDRELLVALRDMRGRQEPNPDVWRSARAAALALATPTTSSSADIEFGTSEAPGVVSELLWEGSHVPFIFPQGGPSGHPLAPDPVWLEAMAEAVLTRVSGGGSGGPWSPGSGSFLSPMAGAACALGLWGHRPTDRWLAALGEEVSGTSFLLSEGERRCCE